MGGSGGSGGCVGSGGLGRRFGSGGCCLGRRFGSDVCCLGGVFGSGGRIEPFAFVVGGSFAFCAAAFDFGRSPAFGGAAMLLFFNLSMRSLAYVAAACDALALVSAAWVFGDRVLALVSDALVSTALVSDDLVSTALVSACDDVERPCSQSSARS